MVTRCIPLFQQRFLGIQEHLTCWVHWFEGTFNHTEAVYLVKIDSSSQQQCIYMYAIRWSLNCGMLLGGSKTFYFFKHPKTVMILTIEHFRLPYLQCLIFEILINIAHVDHLWNLKGKNKYCHSLCKPHHVDQSPLSLCAGMLWCPHHTQGEMALSGVCDGGEEHTVHALSQQRGSIKKSEVSRQQNKRYTCCVTKVVWGFHFCPSPLLALST